MIRFAIIEFFNKEAKQKRIQQELELKIVELSMTLGLELSLSKENMEDGSIHFSVKLEDVETITSVSIHKNIMHLKCQCFDINEGYVTRDLDDIIKKIRSIKLKQESERKVNKLSI